MKILSTIIILCLANLVYAQNNVPFQIYNAKGKKVSIDKMMKAALSEEIVFFGEYHNNPIAHWLQLELVEYLTLKHTKKLTLGFEMFESVQQELLNDYLSGKLNSKEFQDTMRLWTNYKTDYKPLIEFAKNQQFDVVASNVPRRLASLAFKQGRDGLAMVPSTDTAFMVKYNFDVDTTLSQYQLMLKMMPEDRAKGYNFVLAQAIKDATMAKFIDLLWKGNTTFVHFNGSFHSDFKQGIIYYLLNLRPQLKYMTITTVEQNNVSRLDEEHIGRADYIICVKENMTKTH